MAEDVGILHLHQMLKIYY